MKVRVEEIGDAAIVHLSGDFNLYTSEMVRLELDKLLNSAEGKRIIVDVSEVQFFDSAGLATLVEVLKLSRNKHVEFLLTGVQGKVKDVLSISRLIDVFNVIEKPV